MAYGRKDYFWGVAPEKSVFGELQNGWFENASSAIDAESNEYILEYEVSLGYILQVTGLVVTCSQPGINIFSLFDDTTLLSFTYFDTLCQLLFGESGNLTILPGHTFKVRCYNQDVDLAIPFYVTGYGVLQQTIV